MCLFSSSVLPKISTKPIRVKKVLLMSPSGAIVTPVLSHFIWFVNGTCVIKSAVPWWKVLLRRNNWIEVNDVRAVINGEGVHSYDIGYKSYGECRVVYEAEIPAWTPYWVGVNGLEYASAKLVIYNKEFKEV